MLIFFINAFNDKKEIKFKKINLKTENYSLYHKLPIFLIFAYFSDKSN